MAKVNVTLKNPPSGTNRWGLSLYDWTGAKSLGATVTSITGVASFDIPADWAFPLRFYISVVYYPNGSMIILHQAQSLSPDWPNYVAQFIPAYGSYYYNVSTMKFELIEGYTGTITKKELEYNESRGIIPVAGVLQNKRGLFHVTARNDMSTSQPIGIYWFINDPDGLIAEEYTDWKFGTLGAGQTHEFIGGRFTFSKVGKYGTWVDLLMGSKDNPVVIYSARYIGELCTVITTVPVYKGSISRKELEYDSVRGTIPVY